MWFLHRLSLRARLAALVAVVAVVVLTTGALALYQDLSSEVSDAITAELEVRLADMAGNLSSAVPVGPGPLIAQTVDARGAVLAPAGAPPLLTAAELAAALRQQVRVDREVPGVGRHARLLAHPIGTVGGQPVIGVAATTTTALERARRRLVLVLGVAGPALTSAITLTAWLLAGAALRPVRRMAREAGTISMAQPGRRLPQPGGRDEIAELGRTLNQMLARIEATVAHERAFIDDASHELRTPIAVLRGELELAAQDPVDAGAVADGLRSALEETDRLGALTEDLLTLARADAGQLQVGSARTDVLDAARTAAEHVSR
ncbi:MAG TPA: histidine kinase dimerization/phospho-acceptor domain-containing protein, partial [Acidimicrobiia bacterium]|nr:histidine kinase dimerization/phospho-acceptor domain-containing protein [Acidimicrobiia bacterium]